MLLSLRGDHKEHLCFLTKQPVQVIIDFCKLAIDYLQNGSNPKLCNIAAQKLQVTDDAIQNSLYGLVHLLLLSCKHKLSDADFRDSVLTVGFNQEQQVVLSKFYESKQKEIQEILTKLSVKELHYHNLNWRFDVIVASRSLLHQVNPVVTLDLELKDENIENGEKVQHTYLQTDPTNLVHLTEELERALQESKSRHSRKIQRCFNN